MSPCESTPICSPQPIGSRREPVKLRSTLPAVLTSLICHWDDSYFTCLMRWLTMNVSFGDSTAWRVCIFFANELVLFHGHLSQAGTGVWLTSPECDRMSPIVKVIPWSSTEWASPEHLSRLPTYGRHADCHIYDRCAWCRRDTAGRLASRRRCQLQLSEAEEWPADVDVLWCWTYREMLAHSTNGRRRKQRHVTESHSSSLQHI